MKPMGRFKLRRLVRWSAAILAVIFISLGLVLIRTYRSYAQIVDARLAHGYLISRAGIYAAPRALRVGQRYSVLSLSQALRAAGYAESDAASEVWNGSFSVNQNSIVVRPTAGGFPSAVKIDLKDDRI